MIWTSTRNPIRRLIVALLTIAAVLVASPAAEAQPGASDGRARQLERVALDLAVRLRAVPVRDGDFADPGRYCPRDRLAVSWTPPVGAFRFGAYIPPLGPAPGPPTTTVNGVVVCRGVTYAYMGFEARRAAGGWRVIDVPAVDEPPHGTASSRSHGPAAAALPLAAALPPSGSGPLDDLAPYQPQTTCSPSAKPGVAGFNGSSWPRFRARPALASRGTARSAAAASTRRGGPGTGAWPRPILPDAPPPAKSSDGCSGPIQRVAAGRWSVVWA